MLLHDVELNRLSKVLKVDLKYFSRTSVFTVSESVISMFITLVVTFFLANYLSVEGYGLYTLIFTFLTTASIFSLKGLTQSVVRSVSRGHYGTYTTSLKYQMVASLVGSLFLIGVALWYLIKIQDMSMFILLLLLAFFLPLYSTAELYVMYFTGRKDFKKLFFLKILAKVILAIGSIYITIVYKSPIFLLVFICLATSALGLFYNYSIISQIKKTTAEVDFSDITYGLKLSFLTSLNKFVGVLDKYIFVFIGSLSGLATYGVALGISDSFYALVKSATHPILPKISSVQNLNKKYISRFFFYALIGGFLIYGVVYLFLDFLIPLFFPKYLSSISYAKILSFNLLCIPNILVTQYMHVRHLAGRLTKVIALGKLTQVLGLIILVPSMGVEGIIIAHVAPGVVQLLVNGMYLFSSEERKSNLL